MNHWTNNFLITNAARNNYYNDCISSVELWQECYDRNSGLTFWEKLGWTDVSKIDEFLARGATIKTGSYNPYTNQLDIGAPVERELRTKGNSNYSLEAMGRNNESILKRF